jgi:hypothetical protein
MLEKMNIFLDVFNFFATLTGPQAMYQSKY